MPVSSTISRGGVTAIASSVTNPALCSFLMVVLATPSSVPASITSPICSQAILPVFSL